MSTVTIYLEMHSQRSGLQAPVVASPLKRPTQPRHVDSFAPAELASRPARLFDSNRAAETLRAESLCTETAPSCEYRGLSSRRLASFRPLSLPPSFHYGRASLT